MAANRMTFTQTMEDAALVFKLNARPAEGKVLSRVELEEMGYEFGLLTRSAWTHWLAPNVAARNSKRAERCPNRRCVTGQGGIQAKGGRVIFMVKEKLPRLNEAQVRRMASGKSFERGADYWREGALLEPARQGRELRAECVGTGPEPYRVVAVLDEKGVAETDCSCPYDWEGVCKHVVALLLAYVHQPEAFRVVPPLEAMLAERSRGELVALIGEMLQREPGLLAVVEMAEAARRAEGGGAVDAAAFRRQARRALRQESRRAVEKELRSLREAAARWAKKGDWANAGRLYHALLDETVGHYTDELQMMDEDGDIAVIVDEIAAGLGDCLKKSKADDAPRRAWLEALLAAELADIELGGIDLAPAARAALLTEARDDEWARIAERVRAEIARSRDWAREALVRFLAEREKRRGRKGDAAAIVREMGTPEQQALLLAQEGATDEALSRMREILKSKPGLTPQFADALAQAGAKEAAVELALESARGGDAWSAEWLAQHYRKYGPPQEALAWQRRVFLREPSVESFEALREAGGKVGLWKEVRAAALAALEKEKKYGALIEIALAEGDVGQALELLPRTEGRGWRNYKHEVAEAAEKERPADALALYKELAEQAIGERQRSSYRQAAQHLKRAQALAQRLAAQDDWEAYLRRLRTQHERLPALQDELRKARL